jgi:hydrogenase nickel incorporation protein HypA/HybF
MHEMSIASAVLDSLKAEMIRHPGERLARFAMRIGALSGVDAESLNFCFGCLLPETELHGAQVEFEHTERRARCTSCGLEFTATQVPGEQQCERCNGRMLQYLSGDELEIAWLELEKLP